MSDVKNKVKDYLIGNSFNIFVILLIIISLLVVVPKLFDYVEDLFGESVRDNIETINNNNKKIDSLSIELKHVYQKMVEIDSSVHNRTVVINNYESKLKNPNVPKINDPDTAFIVVKKFIYEELKK